MIALTVIAALIVAVRMIFLKISANTVTLRNWFRHVGFLTGAFLFGVANILLIIILRNNDVSVVFPLTSVQYVFAAFISHWYLEERLNKVLFFGIACIILGSILIVF